MTKKFLFAVVMHLSMTSSAQQYRPFPLLDAYWKEGCGGFQPIECSRSIFYIEDTIHFDSHLYAAISQCGELYNSTFEGFCSQIPYGDFGNWIGCIRNDTIQKKVYINPDCESGAEEFLMYDFDLELGDTLPDLYITSQFEQTRIISVIDSVELTDGWHKRFKATSTYDEWNEIIFIEGVGCLTSFDNMNYIFESGCQITCLVVGGQIIYGTNPWNTCDLEFINVREVATTEIKCFPVPANEHMTIDFGHSLTGASDLSVYNQFGQLVTKLQINQESQFTFSTEELPEGYYHFKVDVPEVGSMVKSFAVFRN